MQGENILKKMLIAAFAAAALFFYGCDSAEVSYGSVGLSFSPPVADKISGDSIEIDTVKILLKDIKLKHLTGTLEDNIHLETMVVYLNTTGMTSDFAVENVTPGTYDRVRFEVHKCEGSETPPDPEFREGEDASLRYSVIVKGKFNQVPFIYKSLKSAHQDIVLETPLAVEANTTTNLTITVDPFSWFYNNEVLMDPTLTSNINNIDNNIAQSFKKCFLDNDHDGTED